MAEIYFINHFTSNPNSPSIQRVRSLSNSLSDCGYSICHASFLEAFLLLLKCKLNANQTCTLISGPPYSLFLFSIFLPGKIIYDFRDAWSLGVMTGYGGLVKPNYLNYLVRRWCELLIFLRGSIILVATPGLYRDFRVIEKFLKKLRLITNRKLYLFMNGYEHESNLLSQTLPQFSPDKDITNLRFICLGKFWEYGANNCLKVIHSIRKDFPQSRISIDIFGGRCPNLGSAELLNDSNVEFNYKSYVSSQKDLDRLLVDYDYGLLVLRDESYDFGTKVFTYLGLGLSPYLPLCYLHTDLYLYLKPAVSVFRHPSSKNKLRIIRKYSRKTQESLLKNILFRIKLS